MSERAASTAAGVAARSVAVRAVGRVEGSGRGGRSSGCPAWQSSAKTTLRERAGSNHGGNERSEEWVTRHQRHC